MDYLLSNGKKLCAVKIMERSGRVRVDTDSSTSFPKKLTFMCARRLLAQAYEIKFRGIGVAPVRIKGAGEAPGGFFAIAEVVGSSAATESSEKRVTETNRRIPDRATGRMSFVLKWPSGTTSCSYLTTFPNALRLFKKRLRLVPASEHGLVTAHFDIEVRKTSGGVKRITVAKWKAPESLSAFFQEARLAWNRLPKEGHAR